MRITHSIIRSLITQGGYLQDKHIEYSIPQFN